MLLRGRWGGDIWAIVFLVWAIVFSMWAMDVFSVWVWDMVFSVWAMVVCSWAMAWAMVVVLEYFLNISGTGGVFLKIQSDLGCPKDVL